MSRECVKCQILQTAKELMAPYSAKDNAINRFVESHIKDYYERYIHDGFMTAFLVKLQAMLKAPADSYLIEMDFQEAGKK